MSKPVKFVDLFAGAGGLSLGLEHAGWKCLLASDWWPDAMATFQANHRGTPTWSGDIRDLTKQRLGSLLETGPDWVVGGPPCQGFSTVGKRQQSDPRNGLVREYHRVVSLLKPQGFILENVLGLKDMQFTNQVRSLFEGLGYTVTTLVVRAADLGVPQLRRRVLFVGHVDERWFRGPRKTHPDGRHVSVIDAIGDLPPVLPGETKTSYEGPPTTTYQRRARRGSTMLQGHEASKHPKALIEAIAHIPDGGNRRSIPDHLQPTAGFHNSYSRLDSRKPAVAVTQNMGKPSGTRCIHPFQHRGLTAREGARLQGFPDVYHFSGGLVSQRLQIANAVPPLLGRALGLAITDDSRWASEASERNGWGDETDVELPHATDVEFDAANP
jgi:DNA (cytosine-5)-methyltransferase 1